MTQVTNVWLPPGCRPSKVCSPTEDNRPHLHHGWIKRRGDDMWLLATDAYIVVAIKVEGDAVEGVVPFEALECIERREFVCQISPTAWRVGGDAFTEITYDVGDRLNIDRLPDFDKIVGGALFSEDEGITGTVALDPQKFARLGEALGDLHGLHIVQASGNDPVKVLAYGDPNRRGMVMPLRHPDAPSQPTAGAR